MLDLVDQVDVFLLIGTIPGSVLFGFKERELLLPKPQYVGFESGGLGNFAYGVIDLVSNFGGWSFGSHFLSADSACLFINQNINFAAHVNPKFPISDLWS